MPLVSPRVPDISDKFIFAPQKPDIPVLSYHAAASMDQTLSHFIESFKGTQGAALAVALSFGLLLLTVLQYASMPQKSVGASLPLKIEAVSF